MMTQAILIIILVNSILNILKKKEKEFARITYFF